MNLNTPYTVQNKQLTPYLKHYFVLDFTGLPSETVEVKVPPTGFPVLQFHFGENSNFYHHKQFTSQSLFIGQCSRHIILYPKRNMRIIGINFKPYGLYNLLGISPRQIFNSGIESSVLFGEDNVASITQTLKNEGIKKGIAEIETLLLAFKNNNVKSQPHFDTLVDKTESENGLLNITKILDKTVSIRTFQRYFREVIGISPKLYSQILRHKYIMELLYKNPQMTWSDMMLKGFYYDFAHFTKDFSHFSGTTPKKYLPIKNCLASELLK